MTDRVLRASINGQHVGDIRAENDIWEFQYSAAWLRNPRKFPLSPHLPLSAQSLVDGSNERPVQWYFDNLLPEEGQRILLARDAGIKSEADAFAILAHYGAESAGSLTLLPPDTLSSDANVLRLLDDKSLEQRILGLPRVPLTHQAIKRMSLAGAQHKLAVVLQHDKLYEPGGAAVSTHILKPNHQESDNYPHSVINEWFVMRLASVLGLNVASVHRRYVPSAVYLIDRFDRVYRDKGWLRLHTIDACQLLNVPRTFKYDQGSVEKLAELAMLCRTPAVARMRLYSWLVFNIVIGNSDAHLKNLSFLVNEDGLELAPFYDLLSVAVYGTTAFDKEEWPDLLELAWPVLGIKKYASVNQALVLEAGRVLGLNKQTAARLLMAQAGRILTAADGLYADIERSNASLLALYPVLKATFAGELRCLRAIRHGVIQEMVRLLN